MSSSRDQIILTGTPGNCLAMSVAWRTKSWVPPRRPEAPPRALREASHLAGGTPDCSDSAARDASEFCVVTQHSARSAEIFTVQFIGSMVAWARNGVL